MENIESDIVSFSINDSNMVVFLKNFKFPKKAELDISACDYDLQKIKSLKKLYYKKYIIYY